MRKWIIIGVAGIAMAAVLEFLLTRPKKGTVEWHKREYLSAAQTLRDGTWSARLKDLYYKAIRKPLQQRGCWATQRNGLRTDCAPAKRLLSKLVTSASTDSL